MTTREINIVNRTPIISPEPLQIEMNRKIKQENDTLFCLFTVSVFRESEKDMTSRSFSIRYSTEASFNIPEDIDKDSLPDIAVFTIYPFVRAQISSILSAAAIETLILPPIKFA